MAILSIQDISKTFGSTQALNGIGFSVDEGEIVALLGPSGCGKSTLLSIVAGLELADNGEILCNGVSLRDTPAHKRGFGLMFQDFALFPHMNVFSNVAFGLKMAHMNAVRINQRVEEMLQLVGLPGFSSRDVNTLSGGEQQRIALARALAPQPRLLMLDEPLGSLDRNLRERLMVEIRSILKQMRQTAIYVTHDQEEAFTIADRVVLMNAGRIEQIGAPKEIFSNPASLFVARFLEMTNFVPGEIRDWGSVKEAITLIGRFPVTTSTTGKVTLLVRPDMAHLDESEMVILRGELREISFRGSMQRITVFVNNLPLTFEFPSNNPLPVLGTEIILSLDPLKAILVFSDH